MGEAKKSGGRARGGGAEAWLARCPGCGYDLRGLGEGIEGSREEGEKGTVVCPECGREAGTVEAERARVRARFIKRSRPWAAGVVVGATAAACGVWEFSVWFYSLVPMGPLGCVVHGGLVLGAAAIGSALALCAKRGTRAVAALVWLRSFPLLLLGWLVQPLLITWSLFSLAPTGLLAGVGLVAWVWHAKVLVRVSGTVPERSEFRCGRLYDAVMIGLVSLLTVVSGGPVLVWIVLF